LTEADSVTTLDLTPDAGVDVAGSATTLPFLSASFDAVLATEVLEHIYEPWIAVEEMRRVLRDGGTAVLSTPFVWKIHRVPRDYWRFTDDSLTEMFRHFGQCEVIPVNGAREVLMHVLFQYAEVMLDVTRLPRRALYALKALEWLTWRVIPAEHHRERMWTTGWLVAART